ncbi:barstar family protein [Deinococcus radiodurans]|nr:barstar family protein [Deinococcus radiodurans]
MLAAGHQVSVREVVLTGVRDKEALMLAFLSGLGLTHSFGRNWDALYDVLTDPNSARPASRWCCATTTCFAAATGNSAPNSRARCSTPSKTSASRGGCCGCSPRSRTAIRGIGKENKRAAGARSDRSFPRRA